MIDAITQIGIAYHESLEKRKSEASPASPCSLKAAMIAVAQEREREAIEVTRPNITEATWEERQNLLLRAAILRDLAEVLSRANK